MFLFGLRNGCKWLGVLVYLVVSSLLGRAVGCLVDVGELVMFVV